MTSTACNDLREYVNRVQILIDHLSMLDPNGGSVRHPDWPLQLSGDEDAVVAFCNNLNGLGPLHDAVKASLEPTA